jgi:hypothetical protein
LLLSVGISASFSPASLDFVAIMIWFSVISTSFMLKGGRKNDLTTINEGSGSAESLVAAPHAIDTIADEEK